MKKNKRGFTLIELLAVIVILAIIALIAVPVIMNIISSARKSAFEDTAYGLISAGEMYYAGSLLDSGMTEDVEFTFTEDGKVPEGLNVKGSMPKSGTMIVTRDGKVALAISNGSTCIIKGYDDSSINPDGDINNCVLPGKPAKTLSELAKTNDFATSVDSCVTSGTCAAGTKFAIEVAPGNIKNFYVIKDVDNIVTLLMDSNIGNSEWISKEDYLSAGGTEAEWDTECDDCGSTTKGPLTALNYLESQTAGWTNIEAKEYTLTNSAYGTITRTNARARMSKDGETDGYDWGHSTYYWTSSSFGGSSTSAAYMGREEGYSFDVFVGYGNSYGIRPVIEISK